MIDVVVSSSDIPHQEEVLELYKANKWSSANKPDRLYQGLINSSSLITARYNSKLIGLGNALSDGHLVVYYPHLLVHPEYQGMKVGSLIMKKFQQEYEGFHQQILVADGRAIDF